MDESLKQRLSDSGELPSLPAVAVKLVDFMEQGDCGPEELARIVKQDVALSAKLLRASNTAYFKRLKQCHTVEEATTVLGLDRSIALALGFTLLSSFKTSRKSGLDYRLFWRRSLLSATTARYIAKEASDAPAEQAFLVGLLQDVGILALDCMDMDFYENIQTIDQRDQLRMMVYENRTIGADHCEVGAWLLDSWGLPNGIVEAIRYSDQTSHADKYVSAEFGQTLAAANDLTNVLLSVNTEQSLIDFNHGLQRHWQRDQGWLESENEHLAAAINEVEDMFDQMLVENSDPASLLQRAVELKSI